MSGAVNAHALARHAWNGSGAVVKFAARKGRAKIRSALRLQQVAAKRTGDPSKAKIVEQLQAQVRSLEATVVHLKEENVSLRYQHDLLRDTADWLQSVMRARNPVPTTLYKKAKLAMEQFAG